MIHTNELPLRHLISTLDGKTNSSDGFTGPIRRLLKDVNDIATAESLNPIVCTADFPNIPDLVLKEMSTDQKNCYKLAKSIKEGAVSKEVADLKCGPLSHSRWLNTAKALLFLWIKEHQLEGKNFQKLAILVSFILDYYLVLYFEIKVKNSLIYGPHHVQRAINLIRDQPEEVKEVVKKQIARNAYHAHSEKNLLSLLASVCSVCI